MILLSLVNLVNLACFCITPGGLRPDYTFLVLVIVHVIVYAGIDGF